jgi:ArsR family transcriptional regulator
MITFDSPFRPFGSFTTADATRLADALKAIADPTRLRILHLLRRYGSMSVSDLALKLDAKQPLVSHHLKVLDQSELIYTTKDGLRAIDGLVVARLSRMIDPGAVDADTTAVDDGATHGGTVVPHSGEVSA